MVERYRIEWSEIIGRGGRTLSESVVELHRNTHLIKKRAEGKHFYVYTMAAANKFLRIYYARVNEYLKDPGVAE